MVIKENPEKDFDVFLSRCILCARHCEVQATIALAARPYRNAAIMHEHVGTVPHTPHSYCHTMTDAEAHAKIKTVRVMCARFQMPGWTWSRQSGLPSLLFVTPSIAVRAVTLYFELIEPDTNIRSLGVYRDIHFEVCRLSKARGSKKQAKDS